MSLATPKPYQQAAVENTLDIFRFANSQLNAVTDEASRANIIAHNGCVLLEAPTGAGKTLMAGMIAEAFSRNGFSDNAKIVWFWFTPFTGLVDQTKIAIKKQFPGLRVRDIQSDRIANGTKSGDLFVTTWGSVAASNKQTRKLHRNGDDSVALEDFITSLRGMGYCIGAVVDEAHHSFTKAKEAVNFYCGCLKPEFTLLITATPNDQDVERFKKVTGIVELHRTTVSRQDAVESGLIKCGVKSIAYLASDDQKALVDFPLTALTDALQVHRAIKQRLADQGSNLVPLMLVQVSSSNQSIAEAKQKLRSLNMPEDAIAVYTADEPTDDLLAVAMDESKEVLIFKMAVALGFDAPRAFTLISMRGAKDANFGIQVVGRILRVHRNLQGKAQAKTLPELLNYGYVFLADAEQQSGLTGAAERINAIRTALSKICPYTIVVNVAGENQVQVTHNGQTSLFPTPSKVTLYPGSAHADNGQDESSPSQKLPIHEQLPLPGVSVDSWLAPSEPVKDATAGNPTEKQTKPVSFGNKLFLLKPDIPRIFQTERLPLSTDEILDCIGVKIAIDDQKFNEGLREAVKITRRETDVFDETNVLDDKIKDSSIMAFLERERIALQAQRVLFEPDGYLHPKELLATLMKRMRKECDNRGIIKSDEELRSALDLISVRFPGLVRWAAKECAACHKELHDTAPLPESLELPASTPRAKLNIYGIFPPDLNQDERAFAELLDADTTGTVVWWHRNEPSKPWSIGIVLPSGKFYYPDFVVKVNKRTKGNGLLLVENKGSHILNDSNTLDKTIAEHKLYKVPLMLVREKDGKRFMTVKFNDKINQNQEDQVFYVENMAQY